MTMCTMRQARQLSATSKKGNAQRPFQAARPFPRTACPAARVPVCPTVEDAGSVLSRRQALQLAGVAAGTVMAPTPALAKGTKGFNAVKDKGDAYSFVYPFGWQEVTVKGQDVVFKDIIEPLESISVSIAPTDRADVTEYGDPQEIATTLAEKVLTSPNQQVKLLDVSAVAKNGRNYVKFEFASQAPNYIRHALAVIAVGNGKLYTLVTGANERRFSKVKDQLSTVIDSFEVEDKV